MQPYNIIGQSLRFFKYDLLIITYGYVQSHHLQFISHGHSFPTGSSFYFLYRQNFGAVSRIWRFATVRRSAFAEFLYGLVSLCLFPYPVMKYTSPAITHNGTCLYSDKETYAHAANITGTPCNPAGTQRNNKQVAKTTIYRSYNNGCTCYHPNHNNTLVPHRTHKKETTGKTPSKSKYHKRNVYVSVSAPINHIHEQTKPIL